MSASIKEEITVTTNNRTCKQPGCDKFVSKRGYCWTHAKQNGIDPRTGKDMDAAPVVPIVSAVTVPAPSAQKPLSDGDYAAEIEELFQVKVKEWLDDLNGATTLRFRAKMFLSMLESLEGLGY